MTDGRPGVPPKAESTPLDETTPVDETPPPAAPPRRKLDREETERRLIAAFDRVWIRDGIQGLGVNAVLKETGVGKALLYRYFGDFVDLARAWAEGENFLPRPPALAPGIGDAKAPETAGDGAAGVGAAGAGVDDFGVAAGAGESNPAAPRLSRPMVAAIVAYGRALRARPKTRELLIVELLRTSPMTDALDDMRARFGREMRAFISAGGALEGEDAFALSFFVTAAVTYLALRADAVPDYYGLKLDREESWQRIEQMLERIAARVLDAPSVAAATGHQPQGAVSASAPASPPPRRRP